jgi:formate hydrogenlyase subunit 3/multisubunit Na+/H+ antiporter MnhD subunit
VSGGPGMLTALSAWLLPATVLLPPALLLWLATPRSAWIRPLLPLASLPALLLALLPGDSAFALPQVLIGLQLRVDELARILLLLVGLAWSAAGWFAVDRLAAKHFDSFVVSWLLTLSGLLLAILAGDLAGFYTGYAVMTLAAYGLVVHERSDAACRAARIYLVLAMVGEALLLSGLLLVAAQVGNAALVDVPAALQGSDARLPGALLLGGLAVKIGVLPLHVWLPLAHPVAPVPASAILSGVLVKAGLLGALRLVPADALGDAAVPLLLVVGLATTFYGVIAGLPQQRVKTVLAYSTISQMGLLFIVLVLALAPAGQRDGPVLAVIGLWILHHGLNKSALFLAAGSQPEASRLRLALLCVPALSLAGLPLTTGSLAKGGLKSLLEAAPAAGWVLPWLAWSSLATMLLMLRVLALVARERDAPEQATGPAPRAVHPAWVLLVLAAVTVPWVFAASGDRATDLVKWPGLADGWAATWPPVAALVLTLTLREITARLRRRGSTLPMRIGRGLKLPEGDIVVLFEAGARGLRGTGRALDTTRGALTRGLQSRVAAVDRVPEAIRRLETGLTTLPAAGVTLLCLLAGFGWALLS